MSVPAVSDVLINNQRPSCILLIYNLLIFLNILITVPYRP